MTQPSHLPILPPPDESDADYLSPFEDVFYGAGDETGLTMEELVTLERQFRRRDRDERTPRPPKAN